MKITKQLVRMLLLGIIISATAYATLYMLARSIFPAIEDSLVFIAVLAAVVNSIVFAPFFCVYQRNHDE